MNYSGRMAEDKKQHHLQNILDHINRLTSLLDDVLQINRAETIGMEFNPALMDVAALCRTLVEDTRQINPDHIVELDITGDEALVAADVKLMRQIISNLLSNAVKYSPKHSKVQVALQFEAEDISVIVKDEGMGIPKEDLDNLFGLFHRAGNVGQIKGTGLGLAIVKQAVDAHNGSISVESEIDQGTTFTVRFPARRSQD